MGIRLSQEMEGEVFRVSMRLLKSKESNWNWKIPLGLKMPAQCVGGVRVSFPFFGVFATLPNNEPP